MPGRGRAWFLDYLRTWSSVQNFIRQHGHNPVDLLAGPLAQRWGPAVREVVFPVFARAGLIS